MGTRNLEVSRFEVTGVYTHPDARVDIVLVHGLNGEPKRTWTAKGKGADKKEVFWPADLLPETLKGHPANILVYGYNADVYSKSNDTSASSNFILHHAQTLVSHLTAYRKSEQTHKNAIIWVVHSLGGILVKRALLYSNDLAASTSNASFRGIYVSTYAIIFLGTPHTGSGLATWGHMIQAMSDAVVPKKIFHSESVLLETLKKDNERLQEINNHFLDIYQRFKIHMIHENHATDLKLTKALVVDAGSASPQLPGVTYYGIEATHSGLCKFSGVNAPGYRTVTTAILEWVEEAPPVIEVRWKIEEDDNAARNLREIDEKRMSFMNLTPASNAAHPDEIANETSSLLPQQLTTDDHHQTTVSASNTAADYSPRVSDASTTSPDPPFFHPESFRPNSYFVGRKKELDELHSKLTDKKKRAEGTSAVLIQCLPGGGKTHLARQYVFSHRLDYPGGIYWARAKSITEMEQFYWRIAKHTALRESVQKALGEMPSEEGKLRLDLSDPRNVVDIVRRWFSSFDEWLLVFDGIRFDMPDIRKFVPDAKRTSIIFTSTQHSATGNYAFDNPQLMELGMLSSQEAQELLLIEMEKKKPWTQDDRARALELVLLMGRLPVMIHAAALHLKATHEPLSKYLRTYRARPRAGNLPAYRAVWNELKSRAANPALNLMSILAFFDSWIPVGLVVLGLGALDNRTPVMTKDVRRKVKSLNNSLKILIEFALIERTESDDLSSTSSQNSSRRSYDGGREFVDVLRIHSVVQAFFVEVLAEEKEHNFWLERAARVFCLSFDEADKRIKSDTKLGLPNDYRRFTIHGRKLLEHLARAEKKAGVPEDLIMAKVDVESRLQSCDEAIDRLSEVTQKHIVAGSVPENDLGHGDISLMSVFERTNSLTESDSTSPASQLSLAASRESSRRETGLDGFDEGIDKNSIANGAADGKGKAPADAQWIHEGQHDTVIRSQSPLPFNLSYIDENPYHWHVTQPLYTVMPDLPPDDSDEATEVPTPHLSGSPGGLSDFPRRPGIRYFTGSANGDLKMAAPGHRTIRKTEDRRYRDRAGAWRDRTVSDPRISVSREIARGSVFMDCTSPTDSIFHIAAQFSAKSEAELTLNKIKAAVVSSVGETDSAVVDGPADEEARDQNKARAQSTGSLGVRPLLASGKRNEMDISLAGASSKDKSSGFLRKLSSPPSAWTLATLRRLKENIMPSRPDTSSSEPRPRNSGRTLLPYEVENPLSSSIDSLLNSQPAPMFMGSRTANSSPNFGSGPFQVPVRPAVVSQDESMGQNDPGNLHSSFPSAIRQWDTQVYQPGHRRLDSSDLSFGLSVDDPMASSYPFVAHPHRPLPAQWQPSGPPYPLGNPLLQMPLADGYTSEPMSRNPSGQSQVEGRTSAVAVPSANGFHAHIPSSEEQQHSHSLPIGSRPFPVNIPLIQSRTPSSLIETEPSPQTGSAFFDVNTSYQRWEERHVSGHSRQEAGSGSLPFAAAPGPYATSRGRAGAGGSPLVGGGVAMSRSRSESIPRSVSVSASASASVSLSGSGPSSSFGFPGYRAVAVPNGAWTQSQYPARPLPSSTIAEIDDCSSEPMARSGSGGLKLPDGRIIPFGQNPTIEHDGTRAEFDAGEQAVAVASDVQ